MEGIQMESLRDLDKVEGCEAKAQNDVADSSKNLKLSET
jgi:hypothetical protein